MKVGTDAMLLGALAQPGDAQNILDIGTGTGVLALMMAQKNREAIIDAIEPDNAMAKMAAKNFAASPWAYRLNLYNEPLQQYSNLDVIHYDYIISNPPYFEPSPTTRADRVNARSTTTLTFDELLKYTVELLAAGGTFALILPVNEAQQVLQSAPQFGLHLSLRISVSSFKNSPPIRTVIELRKQPVTQIVEKSIYIYNNDKNWSEEYQRLTAAFHYIEKRN